jgi:hypothetical protein
MMASLGMMFERHDKIQAEIARCLSFFEYLAQSAAILATKSKQVQFVRPKIDPRFIVTHEIDCNAVNERVRDGQLEV